MVLIAKKIFRSFACAFQGLREAFRRDLSFRLEVFAGVFVALFAWYFSPLRAYEFLFLALGYALILIAELINTAFEQALERLHPERHELIGVSKDIASGAVFFAVVFMVLVAGVIVLRVYPLSNG